MNRTQDQVIDAVCRAAIKAGCECGFSPDAQSVSFYIEGGEMAGFRVNAPIDMARMRRLWEPEFDFWLSMVSTSLYGLQLIGRRESSEGGDDCD